MYTKIAMDFLIFSLFTSFNIKMFSKINTEMFTRSVVAKYIESWTIFAGKKLVTKQQFNPGYIEQR